MLENDVKELRVLAAEHKNTVYEMEDKIKDFPEKEKRLMAILDDLHTDREALRKLPIDPETKRPVFSIRFGANNDREIMFLADLIGYISELII